MSKDVPVYIEWVDSVGFHGWKHEADFRDFVKEDMQVKSVGYIHHEDKDCVVLVQSFFRSSDQRDGIMKIPKRAITLRRRLEIPVGGKKK